MPILTYYAIYAGVKDQDSDDNAKRIGSTIE